MSEEKQSHDLPLLQTFIVLFVLTAVEVGVGYLHGTLVTAVLILLAIAKAALIIAVFMHVAYDKDTVKIVISVFVIPMIGVAILILTISSDWRVVLGLT